MWKLRLLGGAMFVYGAVMLLLLYNPSTKDWALDHSIAEVVSYSDRRVDNQVSGSVDEPLAIAGSAVVMFAGAWIGLLVPWVMTRHFNKMAVAAGYGDDVTPMPGDQAAPPPPGPGGQPG